jgi:hypothetical protein
VELDLVLDTRDVADSRTPWQRRPDVNDDVAGQVYFARLEDLHFGRTSLRRRPRQPMKYFSAPSRNSAKLLRQMFDTYEIRKRILGDLDAFDVCSVIIATKVWKLMGEAEKAKLCHPFRAVFTDEEISYLRKQLAK